MCQPAGPVRKTTHERLTSGVPANFGAREKTDGLISGQENGR